MIKVYNCIGLMSGTSLDGVDLVYVKITCADVFDYEIIQAETFQYAKEWITILKQAFEKSDAELKELDVVYGKYLGELVFSFIKKYDIKNLDFIASHGHTIFHKPEQGYTLQIGDGNEISKISNTKVVYDFRTQDVALGGQGAPLVPVGDKFLFSKYDYCLNLGGFANVSYDEVNTRIAFDICPVNIVMNYYMQQIGKAFDNKGQLASKGKINQELLSDLNANNFYTLSFPKSLGFEFVKQEVFPLIASYKIGVEDILRTFLEHAAMQIAKIISKKENSKTLVTGGGAYNSFLLKRIGELSSTEIIIPSKELVEFKEALLFAFLGVLKIEGKNNCLKSVTGASKDHSSGEIVFNNE